MVEAAAGPPPTRTSGGAPTVVDGPSTARRPPAAPAGTEPARIGRFTVLHRLGAGGMGVVYAAYDPELDRKIAVKLVRSDAGVGSDGSPRLLREAQALARVSHPNVVAVHEVGVHEGGEIYIAMEFVTGVDLRLWLEEGRRPWREVLGVYLQAGEGLAAVHQAGLVHRDFKPKSRPPRPERPQLADRLQSPEFGRS